MQVRHWVIFDVVWGQQHRLSLLNFVRLHMEYPSLPKKMVMTAIQWEYYNCCVIADVIIGPVLNGQEIGNRTGYRYQVTD